MSNVKINRNALFKWDVKCPMPNDAGDDFETVVFKTVFKRQPRELVVPLLAKLAILAKDIRDSVALDEVAKWDVKPYLEFFDLCVHDVTNVESDDYDSKDAILIHLASDGAIADCFIADYTDATIHGKLRRDNLKK